MKKNYRINETIESMESTEIQSITTEDLIALVLGNREKAERLKQ